MNFLSCITDSSGQKMNLKRKRQVKNKVVETPEVLKLKKKLKTVQQKLRRSNKKLAAVLEIRSKNVIGNNNF